MKLPLPLCVSLAALFWTGAAAMAATGGKPNIIYILADDWGLGDVKTYGGDRCKIDTPHMDRLAEKGMKFTDAHSSSSVCTPTRYSILTGRYNWRSRLKSSVLRGFSEPLIEPGRETVASMLQKNGYTTIAIGKWHLGMDFPTTDGKEVDEKGKNTDWKGHIKNGPTAVGFDKYWGISASLDMPPYIWIENDRFVGECTTQKSYHPGRQGPSHPDFEAIDVLPTLTERAVATIAEQAKNGKPFFIYMPLNSPHCPIVPSKPFQGKSSLGAYGDFVMETDWAVGQVVEAVERAGIADKTLIIVTADNGCSNQPLKRHAVKNPARFKFLMGEKSPDDPEAHYPSDIYRGHKADIYEGGHRVPFIARWDGKVKPGSVSAEPVCLVDLFATCAEIVGAKPGDATAEDSVSILPALLGKSTKPVRDAVVHHSIDGSFAIRQGKWKLALCPGSGGWSHPAPPSGKKKAAPQEPIKDWVQLFDLESDPAETRNLASEHPELVTNLTALLQKYIDAGRSTPGATQKNNGETFLYPKWIRGMRPSANGEAQESDGLIGADAPAGKTYTYKHSAGEPREMEIFFPPNHDPSKSSAPGLILFHGGNWVGGSLAQFRIACAYFASRGMVCATANYRMLTRAEAKKLPPGESRKRVCVTDAKSAIRWFKQHAKELGFDPASLVVGGASAGGHISALATLNPGLNDPADPEGIDTRPVAFLWFNPAFAPDDSNDPGIDVQSHLAAGLPPTLVFFGDKDPWKKGWDAVHAKIRSMGIGTVELQIASGQDHGFFNNDPWQTVALLAADSFLTRLGLLNGEPTKSMPASGEKLHLAGEAAQSTAAPQKAKAATVEKISIAGKPVTIKVPDQPAPGKPWLWVGEFPGHMKSLEDGLVEKGWHVVHVGVSNQFGSPRAMEVWEKVYEEMHGQRGLSAKPALLGISRGGLYATAWTRLHPDRVGVLFLDNGVCDIRSWPAGFPLTKQGKGSPRDWEMCKAELGYTGDAEAGKKAAKPCDGMLPAIQAGVLLISCHGTADSVVPYEDNAAPLVKMWQENRGRLKLFPKEGADHHPHGLPDPAPLIAAIEGEGGSDSTRAAQ